MISPELESMIQDFAKTYWAERNVEQHASGREDFREVAACGDVDAGYQPVTLEGVAESAVER